MQIVTALGAAIVIGVGAAVVWNNWVRHELFPKRWVEVVPGTLYRSGQISERLVRDVLAQAGIRVVVDLTAYDPDSLAQNAERSATEELGIELHHYPLQGHGSGEIAHYAAAIEAIDRAARAGKPVLVHCAAGSRRSAGVIAAYQLLVEGADVEDAYAEVTRYGRRKLDESGLVPFLNVSLPQLAARLVEQGVIEELPDPMPRLPQPR